MRQRERPRWIVYDNGPEFISRAMELWSERHGVHLHFIEPGKPVQTAMWRASTKRFRDEFLDKHWFTMESPEKASRFLPFPR